MSTISTNTGRDPSRCLLTGCSYRFASASMHPECGVSSDNYTLGKDGQDGGIKNLVAGVWLVGELRHSKRYGMGDRRGSPAKAGRGLSIRSVCQIYTKRPGQH